MKQKSYWCILAVIVFMSCSSHKNPYSNDRGMDPLLMAQMDTANYTEINWLDTAINFGTIKSSDTAKIIFRFKNTGSKPLFLISVQPACGCTVADYSKEPVWENEEGMIKAEYRWNGQIGEIRKTIGVRTNTSNNAWHTLSFVGIVEKDTSRPQ